MLSQSIAPSSGTLKDCDIYRNKVNILWFGSLYYVPNYELIMREKVREITTVTYSPSNSKYTSSQNGKDETELMIIVISFVFICLFLL